MPDRTLDDEAKREIRHGYYAAMSFADAQFGRVLDALDELKLSDNTIVVIIGDNGFHLGEHDIWGKMTLFGWDARVPLIISAPGIGKGGAKTSAISELIDIFPTLTDLGGLPSPPQLDGTSLVPVLKDASATVKTAALTQHPRPRSLLGRRSAGLAASDGLRDSRPTAGATTSGATSRPATSSARNSTTSKPIRSKP